MLPTHRLAPAVRHCRLLPPPPQCLFLRVPFHSTSCQRSPIDEMTRKTHYQRLNVPTNASPATIKKSAPSSFLLPSPQSSLTRPQILLRPLQGSPPGHEPLTDLRASLLAPLRILHHPIQRLPPRRLRPRHATPAREATPPPPPERLLRQLQPSRRPSCIRPVSPEGLVPRSPAKLLPQRRLGRARGPPAPRAREHNGCGGRGCRCAESAGRKGRCGGYPRRHGTGKQSVQGCGEGSRYAAL